MRGRNELVTSETGVMPIPRKYAGLPGNAGTHLRVT